MVAEIWDDHDNAPRPPSPGDKARTWAGSKEILISSELFKEGAIGDPNVVKLRSELEHSIRSASMATLTGERVEAAKTSLRESYQEIYEFMKTHPETSKLEHLETMDARDEAESHRDLTMGQIERIFRPKAISSRS